MKKLVEKVRNSKVDYKEVVLKTVFAASILSVALMAPNALKMFSYLKNKDRPQVTFRLRSNTNKLIKNSFINKTKNGLELTKKGEMELLRFHDYKFKKTKKWNGVWTIISFDFPVGKNNIRGSVRFQLKRIGFYQLQKSVWVFPYDCQELIYLIKTEWKLTDELVYIRAKYVSREKKLKEHFDL